MTSGRLLYALGPSTGGIGAHVRILAEGMQARGWDVTVAGPAGLLDGPLQGTSVTFAAVELPGRWRHLRSAAGELRPLVAAADLVHAHGLRAGLVGAAVARRAKRPSVSSLHNLVVAETAGPAWRVARLAEPLLGRLATRAIGASPDITARLGHEAVTICCSVAEPHPGRSRAEVRASLDIDDERVVGVCAARLHPQKRITDLIAASGRATTPVTILLAGDGPARAEIRSAAARTPDADVRLLGHRHDVADLLGAADFAVLTSAWEAVPLALQEAAWLRLPLVGTDTGGVGLLVEDGVTGRRVPVGDVPAIAAAIDELASDAALRERLGKSARALVEREFTVAGMLDRFAELYQEVLS